MRDRIVDMVGFELKQGDSVAAVQLARQWCAVHGLRLSSVSKSEKGLRLASGRAFGPPVGTDPIVLKAHASAVEMASAVLSACLRQILGNAVEIGQGSDAPEHVHQLRVGLRRLRSALRELRGIMPPLSSASEASLLQAFRELGRLRDRTLLERTVQPGLVAQGGPPVRFELLGAVPSAHAVVTSAEFQDALFGLLEAVYQPAAQAAASAEADRLLKAIRSRLERLHTRVLEDGARFEQLDAQAQHRVRKRLKRLRYLAEFSQALFPARAARKYIDALKPAQDALGLYNDELNALQAYHLLTTPEPAAWFAVGWLSARRDAHAAQCQSALKKLHDARPYWRRAR